MDLAVISKDGKLRMVLSEFGAVAYEDSVRLPHNPTASDLAKSLRILADAISLWVEKNEDGPERPPSDSPKPIS